MHDVPASDDKPPDSAGLEPAAETRRRDSFVALLAHEIRNPLAPIRSGVALLRSGRLGDPGRLEILTMMDRQLSHLVRLVDDLLASVSVRGGEAPANAQRVRLADVLEAALDSVQPAISAKQQTLSLGGNDTVAVVEADPQRLVQALSNLLSASSKRTPREGRIAVEVMMAHDAAEIHVSDTAPAVPADALASVFEMYGPAIDEGLGIGLALVRGLVEMNGGSVDAIDRGPEHGTIFVVRMPLCDLGAATTADAAEACAPKTSQWRSRRVLVVDDNRDARQTLGTLLEFDGHTVRLAHDGPSAVAEARAFCPELVLMDIGLPGYSGLVATRAIRAMPLSSRPVIVALTGWGSAADREATHAAGCDLHLVKPIVYREIAKTLALTRADFQEAT